MCLSGQGEKPSDHLCRNFNREKRGENCLTLSSAISATKHAEIEMAHVTVFLPSAAYQSDRKTKSQNKDSMATSRKKRSDLGLRRNVAGEIKEGFQKEVPYSNFMIFSSPSLGLGCLLIFPASEYPMLFPFHTA